MTLGFIYMRCKSTLLCAINFLTSLSIRSIERDAQLLANRIALLKQEEMKTWKKIDDTKKRTGEILQLKKRNEDRIQKVSVMKIV